jgi:hypothetical protein
MYIRGSPVEIQTSAHCKLIGHSVTAPTPVFIAQQYSPASFFSDKEKLVRSLRIAKSDIVCS